MEFHDEEKIKREIIKENSVLFFNELTEEDIMLFMEGRKVKGYKLDKG